MPPTLDATLSGTTSNSYADEAAADAYFENLLDFTAWDGVASETKQRALISATLVIDGEFTFWGDKSVEAQRLQFPRVYSGYDGKSIPDVVLSALFELALHLATKQPGDENDQRAAFRAAGVKAYKIGDLSETLDGAAVGTGTAAALQALPGRVQRLLSGWIKTVHNTDSGRRVYNGSYDENGLWWPWELQS